MSHQLSVMTDGIVRQSFANFLLVEGSPIRLDLELALRKRFPMATIERFFPADHQQLHTLSWRNYDLILISCSDLLGDLAWMQTIRRNANGLPLVVTLAETVEMGRRTLWAGADVYGLLDDSHTEFAARLDACLEVGRLQRAAPLGLPAWHLQEVLHHSENAVIFLAEDRGGRLAAIKRFKLDISHVSRMAIVSFLHDATLLADISHPGLVRILDVGVSGKAAYVVMEYVQGVTLKTLLGDCKGCDLEMRLDLFRQVTEALGVIHALGLLHRDLKASNVLMRQGRAVLVDYGVEHQLLSGSGFLRQNEIYCTPFYVSPERMLGDPATVQSDLYALGVLFYEMLVGDKPYVGSSLAEVLQRQWFDPIPRLPEPVAHFQPLVDQLLAKLPEQRPDSTDRVLEQLLVCHEALVCV